LAFIFGGNMLKKYFKIIGELSTINRFSQSYLAKPESVLEHSASVAQLAYFIGSNIEGIDMEMLLKKAVFHDMDEIITGDLAHPTKHYTNELRHQIAMLERDNMIDICNDISDPELFDVWNDAKDDTIEGFIICICDIFVVLYKIDQEFRVFGNNSLLGHSVSIRKRLLQLMEENSNVIISSFINEALNIQQGLEKEYVNRNSK